MKEIQEVWLLTKESNLVAAAVAVVLGGVSLISFSAQTQDLFLLESGMYHLKLFVIASIQIEEVQAEEVLNREKEIGEVVIEDMVVHKTFKAYVAV